MSLWQKTTKAALAACAATQEWKLRGCKELCPVQCTVLRTGGKYETGLRAQPKWSLAVETVAGFMLGTGIKFVTHGKKASWVS
jgi:hypothetical protein